MRKALGGKIVPKDLPMALVQTTLIPFFVVQLLMHFQGILAFSISGYLTRAPATYANME